MQITPNRRLALFLDRTEHYRNKAYPIVSWIETLWEELKTTLPLAELLSPYEGELIWEKIITESEAPQTFLRPRSLATLAKDANELMQQWLVKPTAAFSETEETLLFSEWRSEYTRTLAEHHWLDTASLLGVVTEHLPKLQRLPLSVDCVGFSEWTPQQAAFLEALKNRQVTLTVKNLGVTPKSVTRRVCNTSEDELYEALMMAKSWAEKNRAAQIGLVILDLEQRREEVEYLVQQVLPEGSYNVAAPTPLSKQSIISAALLGLSLTQLEIPLDTISRFLRSPFFAGGIEEQSERAAFDRMLHQLKQSHFTLSALISLLKTTTIPLPGLLQIWEALSGLGSDISGKKTAVSWVGITERILTCLGWGQGRPLTPDEKLVQAEWLLVLEMYQGAGKILGNHSLAQARFHIEAVSFKKAFTPPAARGAQIHALGLLEAVGMPFDYLWCLGFSEKNWPKPKAPHPFIPLSLQCATNLPRSHAGRELQKAKEFTQALSRGAREQVIFSHSAMSLQSQNRVSPLLKGLPLVQACETILAEKSLAASCPVPLGITDQIGDIVVPPKQPLKGSLRALSLQAACPFKAFAELRLNAMPLQKKPGRLTKAERGELVHEILHLFWKETKSQENLLALTEESLNLRLKNSIDTVVSRFEKRFQKRATPQYMAIERDRLQALLSRFLALEKTRPSFTVAALECEIHHPIGPLAVSLRIDRIDRLSNGEELLLDYKTGHTEPSAWFEAPPQEPQLSLYCISRYPTPAGMAFAVLRGNDLKYQGIAKEELSIQGIKPLEKQRFELQCHTWQEDLEKLAEGFAKGIASVKPWKGNKPCRYCELQTLCRLSELE